MSTDRLLKVATAPIGEPSESHTQNPTNDDRSSGKSSPSAIRSRFRAGVQAVTAAQRVVSGPSNPTFHSSPTTNHSSQQRYQWNHTGPLEPGINPNQPQPQFAHLSNQPVSVNLVDYSDSQVRFQSFEPSLASELKRLEHAISSEPNPSTSNNQAHEQTSRPPWAAVRWINVNGLSWEVIRLLAIHYQLHPLAVEDCLHTSARSKSEYYKQHLFVHAAVHTLEENPDLLDPSTSTVEKKDSKPSTTTDQPLEGGILDPEIDPTDSFPAYKSTDHTHETADQPIMDLGTATNIHGIPGKEVFDAEREVVRQLTKDYKVRVHVEKLSIFLLRDGTLITIFSHGGSKSVLPLLARLKSMDTLLRSSADASMLLQAVLDIVVDQALDVVEAFRSKLTGLEAKVLVSPDLDTVRHLHVLSGELLLLKRTLNPLSTLVHGIMNHDPSERKITNYRGTQRSSESERGPAEDFRSTEPRASAANLCTGFLSSQAKVYMSDVLDHIDSVLSSLELFSGLASNLVDFTFNTMSFSTNESMRQLSIVTIIFLPLTFLTGYFGMNFVKFDAIQKSDAL
ncbi:hypothetical protein PGT21_002998 [Puccinia graminis f. sp. tritici]|uniref:CorA metal ion transporter n=1 Tax=Puccinia graminis f. sp. tritici TaxID=56615 RepID=A0A5B0NT60_PUCGR|nr:hypothetical protein PGT21_002998 [Puccinia graminis f. sp. tritici]